MSPPRSEGIQYATGKEQKAITNSSRKGKKKEGFPHGSGGKEPAGNATEPGSTPGSGRSPGEWNGYSLQYSFQENSVDRGTWWPPSMGSQRVRHN